MPLNLITGAVGAVAGAVVAGAVVALRGAASGRVDWRSVGSAALGGAIAGGLGGLTLGGSLVVSGGAMVAGGASGGFAERVTDNVLHDRVWHDDVATHTAVGGAVGVAGAAARPLVAPAANVVRPATRAAGRALARGWRSYVGALERRPLLTKSLTSGSVTASGDAVAQLIQGDGFDPKRTAFMGAFGLLWVGPSGHAWYGLLGRLVPGRGVKVIGTHLLLDQAVMAPIGTGVYLASLGAFQGDSPAELLVRLRRDTWPMLKQGYMVWPGVNLVNFAFVPSQFRVLFGNGVGLGWNTWVSLRSHGAPPASVSRDPEAGLPGAPSLPSARAARHDGAVAASPDRPSETGPGSLPEAPRSKGLVSALEDR